MIIVSEINCIFAVEFAKIHKCVVYPLQQFLYNVNKGIVSLSSRLTTQDEFWRTSGELCPLFRSILLTPKFIKMTDELKEKYNVTFRFKEAYCTLDGIKVDFNIALKLYRCSEKSGMNYLNIYSQLLHFLNTPDRFNNKQKLYIISENQSTLRRLNSIHKLGFDEDLLPDVRIKVSEMSKALDVKWQLTRPEIRRRIKAITFTAKKDVKSAVFMLWGEVCLKCGTLEKISLDHVIPITKGGLDRISNLQPLCRSCNSSKGTKIIDYRYGTR